MMNFNYKQLKPGSQQQGEAEAILNYLFWHHYFESISVKISAKTNWGCTLKLQLAT